MEDFHFLRPVWLLALLALPLLDRALRSGALLASAWARIVDPRLLPHLLAERPGGGGENIARLARWLPLLGFTLATLALAGPAWRELPQPVLRDQSSLVVVFDLSRSMSATDLAPSRLERARLKIIDLLEQREEGQTALISFAGRPFVVSPLTSDAATIQSLVPVLEPSIMPVQGSRADLALELAASLLSRGGDGTGTVLLVTDSADAADVRVAERLREDGVLTSVLAVGTPQGAPVRKADGSLLKDDAGRIVHSRLDEERLRALAQAGGGRYTRLTIDDADLGRLAGALSGVGRMDDEEQMSTDSWREEGPWLLLPLIPVVALAFRRGVLVVLVTLMLAPLPREANAFEWSSLWQRRDQRGVEALREERYDEAASLLDDAEWRAAALYRGGQYQEAAEVLEERGSIRAEYNRGTALARAGDYRQAIEVYRDLLDRDPMHADARHNLEVLLSEMERQQQDQQDQQGENGQEQQQGGQPQSADSAQGAQGSDGAGQDPQGGQSQGAGSSQDDEEMLADQQQAGEMSPEEIEAEAERRARQALPEEGEAGDEEREQRVARAGEPQDTQSQEREQQAAVEQWLRRIPDDPGGLLRRKFIYELQRQRQRGAVTEEDPW